MDALTSAVVGFKAAETASQIQYAVAAKMLQNSRSQGDAVVQLLEAAQQSFTQAAENVSNAATSGLDVYA